MTICIVLQRWIWSEREDGTRSWIGRGVTTSGQRGAAECARGERRRRPREQTARHPPGGSSETPLRLPARFVGRLHVSSGFRGQARVLGGDVRCLTRVVGQVVQLGRRVGG